MKTKDKHARNRLFKIPLAFALLWQLPALISATPNLVTNSGFETLEPIQGYPQNFGDWGLDLSEIVSAQLGITPYEGNKMLRFDYADVEGIAGFEATAGDVGQLIDVTPYSTLIDGGGVSAMSSAYFNRIAGDAATDTEFSVSIRAYSGDPGGYDETKLYSSLSEIFVSTISDSDPTSWEKVSAALLLPVGTRYLLVEVSALENVLNDTSYPELAGHYADSVSLTLIPEPAMSSILIAIPVLMIAAGRIRNRKIT